MITEKYRLAGQQMKSLMETDRYFLPVLSNASALLWETLDEINWAGFYIVREGILVLGPFQGKTACIHIEKGRGVCGSAWKDDAVKRVENVHEFPGHIACDSASMSEIVIPIHQDGEVKAVLDIDSPYIGRFTEVDEEGLLNFVKILEEEVLWEGAVNR